MSSFYYPGAFISPSQEIFLTLCTFRAQSRKPLRFFLIQSGTNILNVGHVLKHFPELQAKVFPRNYLVLSNGMHVAQHSVPGTLLTSSLDASACHGSACKAACMLILTMWKLLLSWRDGWAGSDLCVAQGASLLRSSPQCRNTYAHSQQTCLRSICMSSRQIHLPLLLLLILFKG